MADPSITIGNYRQPNSNSSEISIKPTKARTRPNSPPLKRPPVLSCPDTNEQLQHVWRIAQISYLNKNTPHLHYYIALLLNQRNEDESPKIKLDEKIKAIECLTLCSPGLSNPLASCIQHSCTEIENLSPEESAIRLYLGCCRFDLASYLILQECLS